MGFSGVTIGSTPVVSPEQTYACTATEQPGDAVYVSTANTVARASAINPAKMPAIGFVLSKPTTTICKILTDGALTGFTGLTPGATYYVSDTPGQISTTPGTQEQEVGVAYNTTTLVVEMQEIEKAQGVIAEEEGTPVAVTPFTTFNFKGAGVTATDAGGGKVNVTVGGTGASDIVSGVVPFAYSTPSPLTILPLLANDIIDQVEIEIDTPFNDPASTLIAGTVATPDLVLGTSDVLPSAANTYGNDNNFKMVGAETLRLTLNPGTSTAGAGKVLFLVRR